MKTMPMNTAASTPPAPARCAFTLIELLVVITIIGVLAALTLAVVRGVTRTKYINNAQAEMVAIATAIDRYHAAYGVYPPCGANFMVNPLYYELSGTTNNGSKTATLDGMNELPDAYLTNNEWNGVNGFVNCTRGAGDDMVAARVFLPNLKANQIGKLDYPSTMLTQVAILTTSVGGPDQNYKPLGVAGLNPWRYNSISPSNNPNSYDLYVQIVINGQSNLVCNWTKQVQINNASYP